MKADAIMKLSCIDKSLAKNDADIAQLEAEINA